MGIGKHRAYRQRVDAVSALSLFARVLNVAGLLVYEQFHNVSKHGVYKHKNLAMTIYLTDLTHVGDTQASPLAIGVHTLYT
jgi:hypothetical protein